MTYDHAQTQEFLPRIPTPWVMKLTILVDPSLVIITIT